MASSPPCRRLEYTRESLLQFKSEWKAREAAERQAAAGVGDGFGGFGGFGGGGEGGDQQQVEEKEEREVVASEERGEEEVSGILTLHLSGLGTRFVSVHTTQ